MSDDKGLIPAATVVLVRDGANGVEVLMVRRSDQLRNFKGMWVFPGGRIDPPDHEGADGIYGAALNAAIRETAEETGLVVDGGQLFQLSRWTAPEAAPKRFDTWFFVGAVQGDETVVVDGVEIMEHRWTDADSVLAEQAAGELKMMPPTYITLLTVARFDRCDDLRATLIAEDALHFLPKVTACGEELHFLYCGDAGYETGDPSAQGPRHRCIMASEQLMDGERLTYINELESADIK